MGSHSNEGVRVCVAVWWFSRRLCSNCHLIFPIRLYGFRRLARRPGSIDYNQPTNHADRRLGWEHTLPFNSPSAHVHVESREQVVKHNPPSEQAATVTLCIGIMRETSMSTETTSSSHNTHTHRTEQRSFCLSFLMLCPCPVHVFAPLVGWVAASKNTLGGNANDLVSSRSKHWEIKLRRPPTSEAPLPQSCGCLKCVCANMRVCMFVGCERCFSFNLVKSYFTCWNLWMLIKSGQTK